MTSFAIAREIIGIIDEKFNIPYASNTEFETENSSVNNTEIAEKIKEFLPECNILEITDDYILISYLNRTIRCGF